MLASSNISISTLGENYEFFDEEKENLNLRKNFIFLYDNMKNEVMKIEVTIGVSLLGKAENEKLSAKLDKIHPIIPHA